MTNSRRKGFAPARWDLLDQDYPSCNVAPHTPFPVWQPVLNDTAAGVMIPMLHSAAQLANFIENVPTDYDGLALFGNECDRADQGNMPPDDAAMLLKYVCNVWKRIRWIGPNVSQNDLSDNAPWLRAFLQNVNDLGIGHRLHKASMHWYDYDSERRDLDWAVGKFTEVLALYGLGRLPIWVTELGVHWWFDGPDFSWPEGLVMPAPYDTEERRKTTHCPTWDAWRALCGDDAPTPPGISRLGMWLYQAKKHAAVSRFFLFTNRDGANPNESIAHHAAINSEDGRTMIGTEFRKA